MTRNDRLELLRPEFRRRVGVLYQALVALHQAGCLEFRFEVFETFRSSERQDDLYTKGVTKARGGRSPHNFGLAADFVPFLSQAQAEALGVRPGWYWPEASNKCWKVLEQQASFAHLCACIDWDKPHIQMPDWKQHRE